MTTGELEKRLVAVEDAIARLKQWVEISEENPNRWVEKVAGSFSSPEDQAAFDEAARLGRKWRQGENRKKHRPRKSSRK